MRSPHMATREQPHSPQLEKKTTEQWKSSTARNKYKKKIFFKEAKPRSNQTFTTLTHLFISAILSAIWADVSLKNERIK